MRYQRYRNAVLLHFETHGTQIQKASDRLRDNHSQNDSPQLKEECADYDHWKIDEPGDRANSSNAFERLNPGETSQLSAIDAPHHKQQTTQPQGLRQLRCGESVRTQP